MIIRRKHTANFTTIGNALFNDERLEADEVGVLGYLLSRPNDWEVRRPALARRWRIGRDSIKRIVTNCVRTGWMVSRRTRLSNGTFHVVYEVRDEPGPELTPEQVKDALSLVSSEAVDADDQGESEVDLPPETVHEPPTENPSGSADNQPPTTGLPAPAGQHPQTRHGSLKKESLRTDSTKTESPNGRAFADVLAKWPSTHVVSPFACEQLHVALIEALQVDAFHGIDPYLAECEASNRKVCDLATFYRERRWERFQASKSASSSITSIKPHTPEFFRWREYRSAIGDHEGLKAMDVMVKLGRDITVPSRWPPAIGPRASGSTDPPSEESAA